MSDFTPARSSTEVVRTLDPFEVIKPHDPRFTDIEKDLPREHFGVSGPISLRFGGQTKPGAVKLAIIGHRGTGKSTLVRKTMDDLRRFGVMPIMIDALTSFDQANFGLADVMLVIMRSVIAELAVQQIEIDPSLIDSTYLWFAEELVSRSSSQQIQTSIEADTGIGVGIQKLAHFAAKLAGAIKHENQYRVEIRERAARDINELTRRINRVLDGAHEALAHRKQQLCVVLDNLEKITDRELVAKAVLLPAQELRELRTHLLLFLHPADDYAPNHVAASQCYTPVHIPALPVRFKGDADDVLRPEAKRAIHRLLAARIDIDAVFAEPETTVERLARNSGGNIRDLLRLALRAAELSVPGPITLAQVDIASLWLAGQRISLMSSEDWDRAVHIHAHKRVQNSKADAHLLLHTCVLSYDGVPWWDVHPVVRADPEFAARAQQRRDG